MMKRDRREPEPNLTDPDNPEWTKADFENSVLVADYPNLEAAMAAAKAKSEARAESARDAISRAAAGELLTGADLQAIFGIGHSQFAKLRKRGDFDFLRVRPAIGLRCYSGTLVHRYITGQPVYEPTFGRKRAGRR